MIDFFARFRPVDIGWMILRVTKIEGIGVPVLRRKLRQVEANMSAM